MNAIVKRSEISGVVSAPASKSALQRYIAGALLAEGQSEIVASSFCNDSDAALSVAGALGAKISTLGNVISISGGLNPAADEISCGESGLSARMFTPIASLHAGAITITGKGSLLSRPFDMVNGPLSQLGVSVASRDGFMPLKVTGPMHGGRVIADGSVSSQFITGLLMALPLVKEDSELVVANLVSRPYIDLTLSILSEFGISYVNDEYKRFLIGGRQSYRPGRFVTEGDWSGAAFLLVMGAIAGKVTVTGLDLNSPQADRAVVDALRMSGAEVSVSGSNLVVSRGDLRGFSFDISDCPDLAPPLAVLAAACRGKSVLKGAGRLLVKESNRAKTIFETLSSIGAGIALDGDYIEIEGGRSLPGGSADACNDHRIAMALAVAALLTEKGVTITGMESINKSYPGFVNDFQALNGNILVSY